MISSDQLTTDTVNGSVLSGTNTVNGYAAINTTTGNVQFNNDSATLTLAGINQSGSGHVVINNTGNIVSSAAVISNAINLTAGGTITQNATGTLTGGVLTTSSAGGTTLGLNNALSGFNGSDTTGNILLVDAGALNITGISTAGDIALTAGNLTQSGAIAGDQLTTTTVSGSVLNSTNTINTYTASNTTSGNIELSNDTPTLTLAGISQSGGGDVIISNTGAIITSGVTTVNNAGNLDLSSGSNLTLSHAVVANAINLSAGGVLSQNSAGILTTGLLTTNSVGGTTLGLNNALSSFNGTDTTGNILLVDSGTLDITGISTSGNVALTAGSLSQSGIISGNLLSTTTAGGSTLDSNNTIAAYTGKDTAGGNILLHDMGTLNVGSITTSANITVRSTGDITQSDNIASTGGGDISLTSTSGSIDMLSGSNSTTAGGNIVYQATGDLAISILDAAAGAQASIGTISLVSNTGDILRSTPAGIANVRANTVSLAANNGDIGNSQSAFTFSSDIKGIVTLEYAGVAYIDIAPDFTIKLSIDDRGAGVINLGAARSAGTQRSQSSGLEDVGFIDLALFSDINLFVVEGVGVELPADQSDEAPLPGNAPVNDEDKKKKKKSAGLNVSVLLD